MTTVSTTASRSKIVVPAAEARASSPSAKKDASGKTKPEFVVRTNYPESNAPLGVSVSKFHRNHILVRHRFARSRFPLVFSRVVVATAPVDQRWPRGQR